MKAANRTIHARLLVGMTPGTSSSCFWAVRETHPRPDMLSHGGRVSNKFGWISEVQQNTCMASAPHIGDLSCAMVRSGRVLAWPRFGRERICTVLPTKARVLPLGSKGSIVDARDYLTMYQVWREKRLLRSRSAPHYSPQRPRRRRKYLIIAISYIHSVG